MLSKFVTVFKIPELRQKIFLTLALLAVFRIGNFIPLPMVNQEQMAKVFKEMEEGSGGGGLGAALKMVQVLSASSFGMATIFGLGIMPYISASIIFQLLASVYPPLEKLQKEGESGRKKINEYTRYATVFLCLGQSFMWVKTLAGGFAGSGSLLLDDFSSFGWQVLAALIMTAGTILLMWIGEQIDEYGIGNGISLLIMAGILGRLPQAIGNVWSAAKNGGIALGSPMGIEKILVLVACFILVIFMVIGVSQAQRRIPTQSAKHVRGRRVFGGHRQFLPLKVNQSGVMPIIFASSLLMFPMFLFQQLATVWSGSDTLQTLASAFGGERGFLYNLCYVALIYFFCYFWTAIIFNPSDMSNNLKDYGSFIPGYRPGKRTADYLERVMVRITYVGAAFLAVVAVIPTVIADVMNIDMVVASFFGGTSLLIVVSVGLDLVQKIDSHLVMRNYKGLMEED
jgi:preprotein translocase subunit SecY